MPDFTNNTRRLVAVSIVVVAIAQSPCGWADDVQVLADFDGPSRLSENWTARGEIQVQRSDVPSGSRPGVRGRLAVCRAGKSSTLAVRANFPRPDYQHFEQIRFYVKCDQAHAEQPRVLELQFYSRQRPARLWRKVELKTDRWQMIELPLRFFRPSAGASVRWEEVSRFGFHFRHPGTYLVDTVELVASGEASSPYLLPEQLGKIAFGPSAQLSRDERFVVITNDARVDVRKVIEEFHKLSAMIYDDFPELPVPSQPVPMLVFKSQRQYLEFWPKFAARFGAELGPVRSDGYSLLGVAGSYYSEEHGSLRPVFLHEACHAILAQALGLSNGSEWLHEGLANYYQLNWTDENLHQLTGNRVRTGMHQPLRELLDGRRIAMRDYAWVTLFVKWLVEDPGRRKQLQHAMQMMRKRVSTDMAPISQQAFGASIDELEIEWLRWVKSHL